MLSKLYSTRYKKLSLVSLLTSVIGISLLLLSIQLYSDWQQINKGNQGYIIINKPVNILSTLGFPAGFEENEMNTIQELDYIQGVGAFQSNDFSVSLGSNRLGFRTEAFFESVPDEFVDIEYPQWSYYKEGDVIPIILSADYLALYNFGFAPSQGLPQFTPSTINKVTLDVLIRGRNGTTSLKGRIVGFSKRLNSIIVPQSFLEFANKKYGSNQQVQPSRLILEVDEAQAASMIQYANQKGYELNNNKAFGEETSKLINRSILLISFIGVLVLLLTVLVFYLGYKLMIEERIHDIKILFTQGYEPKSIAQHFIKSTSWLILISLILSLVIIQMFHYYIAKEINQIGYEVNGLLSIPTWIAFLIFAILLLIGSRFLILRTIISKYS